MRTTYWSCTKFADWLRGTDKPSMATGEQWMDWHAAAKIKAWRYWLAEEGLDRVQRLVMCVPDGLYAIKYYVNNRWVTGTHRLTAHPRDITPGTWCDVGYRFLPCLFNELQDYVEVELAWWHLAWGGKEDRKKYGAPWWAFGWWRWRTWRSPAAGIDNLKWQIGLVWDESHGCDPGHENYGRPMPQAEAAQEILDLYHWWTQVYRNRPDAYEASGWSEYCERTRLETGDILTDSKDPELKEFGRQALDRSNAIEEQYEKEDEAMMIRLIKIRKYLWT